MSPVFLRTVKEFIKLKRISRTTFYRWKEKDKVLTVRDPKGRPLVIEVIDD